MKEFWSIETVEGVMVEGLYDQILDEDSDEGPDNPRVFSSLKFTTWSGNWDDPKIYKTREDAQKDLNMIPESIRRVLTIVEWTGK